VARVIRIQRLRPNLSVIELEVTVSCDAFVCFVWIRLFVVFSVSVEGSFFLHHERVDSWVPLTIIVVARSGFPRVAAHVHEHHTALAPSLALFSCIARLH
jgi:hypothetical protein